MWKGQCGYLLIQFSKLRDQRALTNRFHYNFSVYDIDAELIATMTRISAATRVLA
jgi:hypothetical protein